MSQETILLMFKAATLLVILVLLLLLVRIFFYLIKKQEEDSSDDGLYQRIDNKTKRLNGGYFGKKKAEPAALENEADMPLADVPFFIKARVGKHFNGKDIERLIRTFGLLRSPAGVYELIAENGVDVLFTMLNMQQSVVFPEDLQSIKVIPSVALVMQLPNGEDALRSYETFVAIAKDMTNVIDGRLCDMNQRPAGKDTLAEYRNAVVAFQEKYEHWMAGK